jgi:hypothetical protein
MKLHDLLVQATESALRLQAKDGSFPAGHNGPWNHADTPLRTTAHWAICILNTFSILKKGSYADSAARAGEYLLANEARPDGFSFFCRSSRNRCNGLVGQAWVLEALLDLGLHSNDPRFWNTATDVVIKHPFNKRLCLWENLDVDGTPLGINRVLNQQIWFAVISYRLALSTGHEEIMEKCLSFFDNLHRQARFQNGVFDHLIYNHFNCQPLDAVAGFAIRLVFDSFSKRFNRKEAGLGYLPFILHILALLFRANPGLPFWKNSGFIPAIKQAISFLNSEVFGKAVDNRYLWSYNPVGFEIALAIESFGINSTVTTTQWVNEQLHRHFDFKHWRMDGATQDPNTLAARIYEATRLPDMEITGP